MVYRVIVKNVEDESTEGEELSHNLSVAILFVRLDPERGLWNRRKEKRKTQKAKFELPLDPPIIKLLVKFDYRPLFQK